MMLIKCLNDFALYSEDVFNSEVVKMNKKLGYSPKNGDIRQLHYKFADRFKIK